MLITAVASALLDNVTTVLLIAPVTIPGHVAWIVNSAATSYSTGSAPSTGVSSMTTSFDELETLSDAVNVSVLTLSTESGSS